MRQRQDRWEKEAREESISKISHKGGERGKKSEKRETVHVKILREGLHMKGE